MPTQNNMVQSAIFKIVKTNIRKKFFKLINRPFPKHYKMSKTFNKNTIKFFILCFIFRKLSKRYLKTVERDENQSGIKSQN